MFVILYHLKQKKVKEFCNTNKLRKKLKQIEI